MRLADLIQFDGEALSITPGDTDGLCHLAAGMEQAAQQHLQMWRCNDGEARHVAARHRMGEQHLLAVSVKA